MNKERLLKTPALIAYVINAILGYCIWLIPKFLLQYSPSVSVAYISLTICGIIALIFSICYGELGSIFSKGYGEPTYYKYFYGKTSSKVYSCVSIFIVLPLCMITSISYSIDPIPGNTYLNKLIVYIVLLLLNILRLNWSLRIQEILTYIKVLMASVVPILAILLKFGLIKSKESTKGNVYNNAVLLRNNFKEKYGDDSFFKTFNMLILLLPLIINAYDGLNSANYITNRIYNPKKTFKKALPIAIIFISMFYYILVTSFFFVVPLKSILKLKEVGNEKTVLTLFCDQFVFFKYSNVFLSIVSTLGNLSSLNGLFIVMIFITEGLIKQYHKHIIIGVVTAVYFIGFINCNFSKYLGYTTLTIYLCYFLTMIVLSYLCYTKKPVYANNEIGKHDSVNVAKLNTIFPISALIFSLFLIACSLYNILK